MAIVLPTNAETDKYDYQLATGSTMTFNKPPSVTVDAALDTYYFDASDAGPTDTGNDWTNDSNAFDGSTGTVATNDTQGTLQGTGTNAPGSGDAPEHVKVRVNVDEGGGQAWTEWLLLDAPSGGWTWALIQALEVRHIVG